MKTKILKYLTISMFISLSIMCQSKKSKIIKVDVNDNLLGVWGVSINENASFRIQSDSIYYPDNFRSYKYTTKNDSIFIHYDGWIYKGIFYISNDSLVLKTQNKENKYVKIVN